MIQKKVCRGHYITSLHLAARRRGRQNGGAVLAKDAHERSKFVWLQNTREHLSPRVFSLPVAIFPRGERVSSLRRQKPSHVPSNRLTDVYRQLVSPRPRPEHIGNTRENRRAATDDVVVHHKITGQPRMRRASRDFAIDIIAGT